MVLQTRHNVESGLYRLMQQPRDILGDAPYESAITSKDDAPEAHVALYLDYLDALEETFDIAEAYWEMELEALTDDGLSLDEAIAARIDVTVAGPAAHGSVVWLVREFWLRCAEANDASPGEAWVPPEAFLLKWPHEEDRKSFVQLLTAMPYWPIGLDENGNWC